MGREPRRVRDPWRGFFSCRAVKTLARAHLPPSLLAPISFFLPFHGRANRVFHLESVESGPSGEASSSDQLLGASDANGS
jgi:hypothetical protein